MKFRLSLLQGLTLALWSASKAVGQSHNDESGKYILPEGSRMNYFIIVISDITDTVTSWILLWQFVSERYVRPAFSIARWQGMNLLAILWNLGTQAV